MKKQIIEPTSSKDPNNGCFGRAINRSIYLLLHFSEFNTHFLEFFVV